MNTFEIAWDNIIKHAGDVFHQKQGKAFTYKLQGQTLIPSTTNISLPRSEFEKAWNRMPLNRPQQVNDLFGPSYLYAILTDQRVNIC